MRSTVEQPEHSLAEHWRQAYGGDTNIEDLEARLQEIVGGAHAAWPEVDLAAEVFVRHMAHALANATDLEQALAELRGNELFIACACTHGVPSAHRVFEEHFIPEAKRILARAGTPVEPEEFLQRLRDRLLVPEVGGQPRIAAFSGRGELRNWVRIAAHRLIVDGYRKGRDPVVAESGEATDAIAAATPDPELAALKATYREGFQAAFEAAFAALPPAERTLLRYRYVDGLEVQQIAAIDGRHRVSVSRALSRARESLLSHLRRDLAARLHIGMSEADSVVRLMQSQLHVSLSRLLHKD